MRLLILGAGNGQLEAIKKARAKGITVIVTDYYENPPGKAFANFTEKVSTFDVEENIKVAQKYKINGVMTVGTDQPVYTASVVAKELGLPSFVDTDTAKAVTNKQIMKKTLTANKIPIVPYRLISEKYTEDELKDLSFPVVMKPIDSQGQRGVFKLETPGEVKNYIKESLKYSREKEVLVEEFYENDEITVSGWVIDGKTFILSVTDRITCQNGIHIGICTSHHFPSKHLREYYGDINDISQNIVKSFNIMEGPFYFQMFVGNKGIKVNEISCRIGGAHEDEFIPGLTGIDFLDWVIDASLGRDYDYEPLYSYNLEEYILGKGAKAIEIPLVFARPGIVKEVADVERVKKIPGVMQARFYIKKGHEIKELTDATQRVGYMIVEAMEEEKLKEKLKEVFSQFYLIGENGENLVLSEYCC